MSGHAGQFLRFGVDDTSTARGGLSSNAFSYPVLHSIFKIYLPAASPKFRDCMESPLIIRTVTI
jgi:hypothetical protein